MKYTLKEFFLHEGDALDLLRIRKKTAAGKPAQDKKPPKDAEQDFWDRGEKNEGLDEGDALDLLRIRKKAAQGKPTPKPQPKDPEQDFWDRGEKNEGLDEGDALDLLRIRKKAAAGKSPDKKPAPKDPEQDFWDRGEKNEHTDPTCKVNDQGSSIWSDPENPADVRKFSNKNGNLHVDIKEMFGIEEMGGPGSGRKKGSKNKPKGAPAPAGPIIRRKAVDPSTLPDEMPDDFGSVDVDTSAFDADKPEFGSSSPAPEDSPFARSTGDLGTDDDLEAWLNDPDFGKDVKVPTKADAPAPAPTTPAAKKSPAEDETQWGTGPADWGQYFTDLEDNDGEAYSWKEFMKVDPPVAKSIAQEFPDVKDNRDYFFTKTQDGDVIMRSAQGARYKWDPINKDWIPMDEGPWTGR